MKSSKRCRLGAGNDSSQVCQDSFRNVGRLCNQIVEDLQLTNMDYTESTIYFLIFKLSPSYRGWRWFDQRRCMVVFHEKVPVAGLVVSIILLLPCRVELDRHRSHLDIKQTRSFSPKSDLIQIYILIKIPVKKSGLNFPPSGSCSRLKPWLAQRLKLWW